MEAVADASTIILLAKIKRLDLLTTTFKRIILPPAVRDEVLQTKDPLEENLIANFINTTTIDKETTAKSFGLGNGEEAALTIAIQRKAVLLTDDAKARTAAKMSGLSAMGVLGITLLNVKNKTIPKKEARDILEQLLQNGAYISTDLYGRFLVELEDL